MDEVTAFILAVLVVIISVFLFILTYILNKRTPKPEGCENVGSECEGCQITSCSHYVKKEEKIDERKEDDTL